MKKKRFKLPKRHVEKSGALMLARFASTLYPLLQKKTDWLVYLDIKNEAKTGALIRFLRQNRHKIYVPCVDKDVIKPSLLKDGCRMKKGCFSIPEPVKTSSPKSLKDINVVIAPGLAFDIKGMRLGFGAGYFDRFLKKLPKSAVKIGLAYDFQLVQKLPQEKHDIAMDYIVTDKRIIHAKG